MALKSVPIKPVEAYRLDDPRRPAIQEALAPEALAAPAATVVRSTPARRASSAAAAEHSLSAKALSAPPAVEQTTTAPGEIESLVNPYARSGRPHQVAVSLYVPQWERIEEQCAELRSQGIRDATITRWLFAVLHFCAPGDPAAAVDLLQHWLRLEANEAGPYFGLRKEARGVRFFEALWDRQRATVSELRQTPGLGRPTLAVWTTAVVELSGPKTAAEARERLRHLRVLLAGDAAPAPSE